MRKQRKEIDWSKFRTGEEFQNFCNKLLEFEFGPDLVPFGARGPDEGIDAQFKGQYNNKKGEFIFQAKFFSIDESKARGLLTQRLEGTGKRKGEFRKIASTGADFYYVLTNVKITPYYKKKIDKMAENYDFEVIIWDGEKLENLIFKHPLVYQWYFGKELPLFLRYQDLLSRDSTGKDLPNHKITFYDREGEKKNFKKFLESDERILMIYGRGGIGKTRILIEFARIAEQHGWTQRFVRIETETFDEHLIELSPDTKYVLFLDDAHKYGNFDKLLSFVKSEEPTKMKLVLSVHPAFLDSFRNEMLAGFNEIEIPKLNNKEILQLLEELEISGEEKDMICEISQGIPLITILAAQLRREGFSTWNIPSHKIMQRFFNRSLDKLSTGKSNQYTDLLRILAFLVPLSIRNDEIHKKIAEFLGIPKIREQKMIQDLMEKELIEIKAGKLRIEPNLLGEHLILQACFRNGTLTGFHTEVIENFMQFAPKQIINSLALVESKAENRILLDGFLEDLKKEALEGNNATKSIILTFLETLSYLRPDDTLDILENMLETKKEPFEHVDKFWGKITIDDSDIRRKVAKQLEGVANSPDAFEDAVEILKDLALEEGYVEPYIEGAKKTLLDVCSIQYYRDIRRVKGNRYEYRNDFREKILEKTRSWSFQEEFLDHIILEITKEQLEEIVSWSKKSLEKRGVITLFQWPIPEDKQLLEIRTKFLDFLFEIGSSSPWKSVRAKVPDLLFSVWAEMLRREKREKKSKGKERNRKIEEKEKIFKFLMKRAKEETDWSVIDNIVKTLRELESWEEKNIQQEMKQLLDQFEKDDEFQLYRVLIGYKEDGEHKEPYSFIEGKVEYFSRVFSSEQLAELLTGILGETEAESSYFAKHFLFELGIQVPDYALTIFELLQKSKSQAKMYFGYILGGLRISKPQTAASIIEDLETSEEMYAIVDSYELLRASNVDFENKDLDLLEKLAAKADDTLRIKICSVLPNLQNVNPNRYLKILENISYQITPELAEIMLRDISPMLFEFSEDKVQSYESIIMNFLSLENIFSYRFNFIMNEITKYDPLFLVRFFEKRVEYKKTNEMDNRKYVAIPFSFDEAVENLVKEKQHLKAVLSRVRDWMEKEDSYAMRAPSLFWSICSKRRSQIKPEVVGVVQEVLKEWIDDGSNEKLQSVARLLHYFPSTEWIFELFEEIIVKSEGEQQILSSISAAIGTTQVEVISPEEPSPQLLHQIVFLENMLKRSKNRHVRKFAQGQIKATKEHIKWMAEIVEEKW